MSQSRKQRKDTQRERLLEGMLSAALQRGYAGASVTEAVTRAGVSRPTFYEHFADRDDCFLAVHREVSRSLIKQIGEAVQTEPPERAVQVAVSALILHAEAKPDRVRFLVNETPAGGARGFDLRDLTISRIERIVERAYTKAPLQASTPDLPTGALIGGICGLLAPRLRRNEHDLRTLADDVTRWIDSYRAPTSHHRWRTLTPGPELPPPRHVSELALRPPPALPPGRPSISPAEVARNQRNRILYATAEVTAHKGYAAATVADITRKAGVDRRVFYSNFRDKQHAFLAVYELGFQQMMAVCASAFFSSESWPERIWEALRAGTHFDATHPVFSHICHVEAHAVGSPMVQRVEDNHTAFSMFLQEGCLHADDPPPRTALDAIAATIHEIGYQHARSRKTEQLPRLVPHAAYLVLAPFLGRSAAEKLIEQAAQG